MSLPALDDFLNEVGVPVTGDALLSALSQVGSQRLIQKATPGVPLTDTESAVLAHNAGVQADPESPERIHGRAAAKLTMLYGEALATGEVAQHMHRSPSRVRHLAQERHLYTLPADRRSGLLFPRWQFTDSGQPLPGLAAVLPALPSDLHPLQVLGFFTSPTIELALDSSTPMSPSEWLTSGGDPNAVVRLATAYDEAA